jgi:glycosyltransferase involved in cell wall biosynthesis
MLYLALIPGKNIGWGVCSANLIKEISGRCPCEIIPWKGPGNGKDKSYSGSVFHTIGDHNLNKVFPVKGDKNYGYTFFENLIPDTAIENARFYDIIFAGSTWCRERLEEKGILWTETLIQGVDPDIFYPLPDEKPSLKDQFVIFSGGKFELRKGQDLVIRAVKVLQDRHKDVLFINLWANPWRFSMDTMAQSPYIAYRPRGTAWNEIIKNILADNGMDLERIIMGDQVEQQDLKKIYAVTDLGIFPNRCEGGTNLVLMEYMACGKPVIASHNTGHTDILTSENAILLEEMNNMKIYDSAGGRLEALWQDPDLEELIWKMEEAYEKRDQLKKIAHRAGEDMKEWTWERSAGDLLEKIGFPKGGKGK